jgi:hypothetical protein
MKKFITTAILVGGAVLASQSGFAQYTFQANYLYMGFQNKAGGGASDYIINLGPASDIIGGSSVVDLSTDFSSTDFDSVLGGSSSMYGGVVGGNQYSTQDIYLTQMRSGGAGNPAVPGSSLAETPDSYGIEGAVSTLNQVHVPATTGAGTNDTFKTWESYVEPTLTASTFFGNTGINPDWPVSKSTILYEDLWSCTASLSQGDQPYVYLGYFALDLTGGSPKLTFVPKNAPAQLTQPVILSISNTAGTVTVVSSNAAPTHVYQLQYTTSLSSINWVNTGSAVTATTGMVTNSDTTVGADSQRFYRVQAQ